MKKLMRNKERRDTLLLILMAIIFALFLVYLFVPTGHKGMDPGQKDLAAVEKKVDRDPGSFGLLGKRRDSVSDFNRSIESELGSILDFLKRSEQPFRSYPVDGLRSLLLNGESDSALSPPEFMREILGKINRLGFYDLVDIFDFEFPEKVDPDLVFNLYTGFFMIKLRGGSIYREIIDFPDTVFRRIVSCRPYLHIGNEIDRDFQSLPALFYFYMLLQRLDIYPVTDNAAFLKTRMGDIRDLSEGKIMDRICSLLDFSQDPRTYRISWVEEDDLNPDDRGSYKNLKISTYSFLNQTYLVFPDSKHQANNRWIRELQESDSGSIELVDFQLSDEDPVKNIQVQAIYYAPGTSCFVVLLSRHGFSENSGFPDRLVYRRLADVDQFFLTVDFSDRYRNPQAFKDALLNFGQFIKNQVPVRPSDVP